MLLVGGYPPLYGGVNVHCQRLAEALRSHVDVRVIDYLRDAPAGWDPEHPFVYRAGQVHVKRRRTLRILWQLRRMSCDVVHFHAGSFNNFALLALPMLAVLPPRARTVVTIHSGSFPAQVRKASPVRRLLMARVLRGFDRVICVSEQIQRAVLDLYAEANTVVVPAYLPPVVEPEPSVSQAVARLRAEGVERVFVVAGFAKPYYGFHVVLDALERDEALRRRVGVLFAFYSHYDEDYHQSLLKRLEAPEVLGGAFDNLTPERFAYLLSQADGFIRPTDRDGDSIAVREARAMGKQVLASDCVERPDGVLLFETMDSRSLADVLHEALEDRGAGTGVESPTQNWTLLCDVYQSLGLVMS